MSNVIYLMSYVRNEMTKKAQTGLKEGDIIGKFKFSEW